MNAITQELREGRHGVETHERTALPDHSAPEAKARAIPRGETLPVQSPAANQTPPESHVVHVGGGPLPLDGQSPGESHDLTAVEGNLLGGPPNGQSAPRSDAAGLRTFGPLDAPCPGDDHTSSGVEWVVLRMWAETVSACIDHRVAAGNRAGRFSANQRIAVDQDVIDAYLAPLLAAEKVARRQLVLAYRKAVGPNVRRWQTETPGIGDVLLARLLGQIGDPYVAHPKWWEGEGEDRRLVEGEPFLRNVAKLWAYCGRGDPQRRKRKGMDVEDAMSLGNPRAKMLTHLIAEGAVKEGGRSKERLFAGEQVPDGARWPYRRVYEEARLAYRDRDGWTDGHQHAAALRLVAKEVLRDLWVAAKLDYEERSTK